MKKGVRNICIFLGLCVSTPIFADTGSDYRSAEAYIANQHLSESIKASVLNAKTMLPPSPNHPDQEKYYSHPALINTEAASNVASANTVGNLVRDDALTRPKMTVNPKSPEVEFSKKVQDNADAISQGTYKDCDKKIVTDNTFVKKTCTTSLPFKFDCIKTLNVRVEEQWVTKQRTVRLPENIRMSGSANAYVNMPVTKGLVTGLSLHVRDGSNPWSCSQTYGLKINGMTIGWYHGQCHRHLGDLQFNVSGVKIPFNNKSITLTLMGGHLRGVASGSLSLSYKEKQKVAVKTWGSSCASIPSNCRVDKTQCLEPGSTKSFDGIFVSAACWQEVETNQCGAAMSKACKTLENEGCTQIGSRCAKKDSGICQYYSEIWVCPNKKTIGSGIQCGEKFYCMDGSCQATHHEKNTAFGKSITELSATASAAKDVKKQGTNPNKNPNSIHIFTGHAAHCREVVLRTLNCCANRGWAKDIFANCNSQEKALGHAKEQGGLVVYIGRYCSNKVLGACVQHKRGYCIFPSRIAYDVQVGGRRNQLGRGFGDAKSPDCSGLSASDIGKINFDKVDFSNSVNSVVSKKKLPSDIQSQHSIEEQIKKKVAQEQLNG